MERVAQPNAPAAKICPTSLAGLAAVHLLALFAPFTFTNAGLVVAVVLYALTAIGVSVGYHRLFSHRSFVAVRPVRWLLGLIGGLALQGGPFQWCVRHRLHHRHSDRPTDPQQSAAHFWWAHIGWAATAPPGGIPWAEQPVVADLRRERFLCVLEAIHLPLNALFATLLFTTGWLIGGWSLAASLLVWGFGVRVVALWHSTLLTNSVAHRWGSRRYATPDNSRNVWWLLPFSLGECWHNNHHAQPTAAAHGHRWFEFDPSYALIRGLGWLGLASRIVRPRS